MKRWLTILLVSCGGLLIAAAVAFSFVNPAITRYVEGDAFRAELEKQTAKGLHFPTTKFAPIKRTGFLSGKSASFEAENGRKAMTKLDTHDISARFNPLGVFLKRWQVDDLHIGGGEVAIQMYKPQPTPTPSKPWFHVFLPDRVYLKRVHSEPGDVTWMLGKEKGGIFGMQLLITPHGRDFEYRATGGTMKNPIMPDLPLRQTHMLITKERFSLYTLDLAAGDGSIRGQGTAGLREDKSVDFKVHWENVPVRDWLPPKWRGNVAGVATGNAHWTGSDLQPTAGNIRGSIRLDGAQLSGVEFLEQIASVTQNAQLATLDLNECTAELDWALGKGELKNLAIEDDGKFRIEGTVRINGKSLGGAIQLGMSRRSLEWLPNAKEVFTRERGGYLWTTVNLSGTLDSPQQDLSPRVLAALKEKPGAFLGTMFRALGEWLDGKQQ